MAHTAIRLGYISTSGGGGGGIVEFATLSSFPAIGQSSLVYLALDTKKIYKWSSGAYLLISPSEVTSVNTEVGAVVLDKTDIGLGNVDNTSDANKPISTATQTALDDKVAKAGDTMTGQLVLQDSSLLIDYTVTEEIPTTIEIGSDSILSTVVNGDITTTSNLTSKSHTITRVDASAFPVSKTIQLGANDEFNILLATVINTVDNYNTYVTIEETGLYTQFADNTAGEGKYGVYSAGEFGAQTFFSDNTSISITANQTGLSLTTNDGLDTYPFIPTQPEQATTKKYVDDEVATKEDAITAGTTSEYWRGDKTFQTLDKSAVGLSNVDNTSDANKPISTATQTALNAKLDASQVGVPNGAASLDGTGKVPSTQLPSYVDDVVEYANLAAFPVTGETGKIYLALDTNKIYRWSGSAYIEISQGISDHILLSNIGTNTHANIDTHIAGTSAVHGVTGSVVGTSDSQALTNKTFDADLNTVSNIDNADIKAAAAIDRTKLASGTINHVVINNASGVMSSEAALAASRGGLGTSGAAFTGVVKAATGVFSAATVVNADVSATAAIARTKLANGTANRIVINNGTGVMTDAAAITASRALVSDATGIPTASTVTSATLAFLDATSSVQTQLNGKEPTVTAGTTSQYYRGDKTFQTLDKAAVGLANVDNTSDLNKPISTATQTALNGKADTSHTQALSTITQSGATTGQVPIWNGTTWTPGVPAGTATWGGISGTLSSQTDLQSALDGKFDDPTGTTTQYVRGDGSIADFPTSINQANSLVTTVFNKSGAPISKFSVVYINGGQGDMPTIALAQADGETNSSKTYGVVLATIPNMTSGQVIVNGALTGVNTDQFNPTAPTGDVNGTALYLSPTVPGGVTTTKPSAPNHMVYVATIVRTHLNEGVVEVRIQNGFELQELHNVQIPTGTAQNNQVLKYDSSTSLWKNRYIGLATDIEETPFSITNNQSSPVDITGFAFPNATVRSFKALVSVFIDATSDFYEVFEIKGLQKGSEWDFTISSQGDVSGITFSITNAGQVQYTSTNNAGFISGVIKFRALTTSV